jgi:hypothetical protein
MPVGDIFELVIYQHETVGAVNMANVFHFRSIDPASTCAALIADWIANAQTEWRGCQGSNCFIDKYVCRTLIPFNADYAESPQSLQGSAGSVCIWGAQCAVMTWRTGFPGRRKRGRTYIGGVGNGDVNGARLQNAFLTGRLTTFGNKMIARYGPSGTSTLARFGVWSRLNAGATPPYSPSGFTQVVSFTPQPNLGLMGTRRYGRGW